MVWDSEDEAGLGAFMIGSKHKAISWVGDGICSDECEGDWLLVGVLVSHG